MRSLIKGHIESNDGVILTTNIDGDEGDILPIDVSVLESHIDVYC